MTRTEKQEIRRLLRNIRKKLISLYDESRHRKSSITLCGWCAISSYVIFCALNKYNYNPVFCANNRHAFIKLNDYYIDITIKQFGKDYPQVWFRKRSTPWHEVFRITNSKSNIWKLVCRGWNSRKELRMANRMIDVGQKCNFNYFQ